MKPPQPSNPQPQIFRREPQRRSGLPRDTLMLTVRVYATADESAYRRYRRVQELACRAKLSTEEFIRRHTPGLAVPEQFADGSGI